MISLATFGIVFGFIFAVLFVTSLIILTFLFWIFMIIDCAKRKTFQNNEQVVWILVLIFLHILGAILYYFIVKYPLKSKVDDKKKRKK